VPGWARVCVLILLVCSAVWQWRRARNLRRQCSQWSASGEIWLLDASQRGVQIEVLQDSADLGWLVVLHWQELESSQKGRAALTRDAFTAEQWRTLRRHLRWNLSGQDGSQL
jgi:hypothetical protein